MSLTPPEHQALHLTAELWRAIREVVAHGPSRDGDLHEAVIHIHAIQQMIMAQSAARAHPDLYRLLGEEN